jgi:hypothetical protein
MRQLEAFTLGKKFGHPETNEDSFVALPDRGYAVIDGVTDRNGTRYDGKLSGRFASHIVRAAAERYFNALYEGTATYEGPVAFIGAMTEALHAAYQRLGVVDAVHADWKIRAGCTIVAAIVVGDKLEIVAVGDSGIRINGSDTLQVLKPLDDVTSLLRREAFKFYEAQGLDEKQCDERAAALTWPGTRHAQSGLLDAADIAEIERRALAACKARLPDVPEAEFLELIHNGIAHGQGNFQNVTEPVLGYGGLDGFFVPERYIETRSYRLADIETIELYSDGYFRPGDAFGVESWEKAFRDVEAEDPHKIGRYLSTKGTTELALTDDRTYLGVRLK